MKIAIIGGGIFGVQIAIKLSKNPSKKQANFSLNQITVSGLEKLMNNLSQCCNPLPPEKIQGYITLQKGISIHRQDCRNHQI